MQILKGSSSRKGHVYVSTRKDNRKLFAKGGTPQMGIPLGTRMLPPFFLFK